MKKLIVSFILLGILIPFLPFNTAASELPDIDVEITYIFDQGNHEVPANMIGQAYGSTINPTPVVQSGYTFKYWVVNGIVRDDLPEDHNFYVTSSLNLIGVYSPDDSNVVLFIDSNGKIIDTQFVADQEAAVAPTDNLPTKPGLVVASQAWVNKLTGSSDLIITDDSIFVLQYESASADTFDLTVDGVLEGTYNFNQVVTLNAAANDGADGFSHWEENGVVVSRDSEYSFTMLSERALVSMTNDLSLRDGYQSYMGQFYLPSGADLVEYGFLIHSDNTLDLTLETEGVTIAKSNNYNPATNEFLTSFPIGSHMNVKAYVVYNDGSVKDAYSDNEVRYIYNDDQILLYETGFEVSEGFTAGTTYNNTTVSFSGLTGEQWGTYYGTPSTTAALVDAQSMQMRWYTSAPENLGYTFTDFDIKNATAITFNAANTSSNNLTLSISKDKGLTWNLVELFTLSSTSTEYTYSIPSEYQNEILRFKFDLSFTSTPSNGSRVYLDNVQIFTSSLYSGVSHLVTFNDADNLEHLLVKDNGYISSDYILEKEGYTFDGWYLEDTFVTPFDIETDTITSDITLYAKWSINEYTITFNSNGGSAISPITDDFGATITPPANPTKDGYTFDDWYLDAELTTPVVDYTMPSEDITVYAGWDLVTYDITYVMDGGTNNPSNPTSYNIESATFTLLDSEKEGYSFDGWFTDAGLTAEIEEITLGSYGHIMIYAGFTEIVGDSYIVTFESNGGSSVSSQTVADSDYAVEPTPTRSGSTFAGWFIDDVTFNNSFDFNTTAITSPITLYAKWNLITYVEDFAFLTSATTSYTTSIQHTDDNGFEWDILGRIDIGSPMLGNSADGSYIKVTALGGISSISFDVVRAFTNSNARSGEVFVNGVSIGTFTVDTSSNDPQNISFDNINISGEVVIEIMTTSPSSRGAYNVDNLEWVTYSE